MNRVLSVKGHFTFPGFDAGPAGKGKYLKPKLSDLLRELCRDDASGFAKTSGIPVKISMVFRRPLLRKMAGAGQVKNSLNLI